MWSSRIEPLHAGGEVAAHPDRAWPAARSSRHRSASEEPSRGVLSRRSPTKSSSTIALASR